MNFFDLHCDTLYEINEKNQGLFENNCHVSIKRSRNIKKYIGCFAFWMPDKYRGKDAIDFFNLLYKKFEEEYKKNENFLRLIKSGKDLKGDIHGKLGMILSIEGCSVLGGDIGRIKKLYELGIRVITLTWNGANEIGDGTGVKEPKGITEFGITAVKEMEKNKIIIDLSHASKKLFYDVYEISQRPIIVTHANSFDVCGNNRNIDADQFKLIKKRGGILGITFCKKFLNSKNDASVYDIIKHIDYFLSLGGQDVLSIGSDFDGTEVPDDIKGIQSIDILYEYLLKHNYKEDLVDKIFFNNAEKFFEENMI